jgi:hypothetical protein
MRLSDALAQINPNAMLFEPRDLYDRCVVALAQALRGDAWARNRLSGEDAPCVAVYDRDALIKAILGDDGEMGYEDAAEWVDFNMAGGWLGPNTPIVVSWSASDDED